MATAVSRGKATINGSNATYDVLLFVSTQSLKLMQEWEEEVGKDSNGFDAWWLARNEHGILDIKIKFVAPAVANTSAFIAGSPVTGGVSTLGQPFMTPLASVTITGAGLNQAGSAGLAALNGVYQNMTGADVDMENTKVADGSYKLRRYADSTQNTLANTVPA